MHTAERYSRVLSCQNLKLTFRPPSGPGVQTAWSCSSIHHQVANAVDTLLTYPHHSCSIGRGNATHCLCQWRTPDRRVWTQSCCPSSHVQDLPGFSGHCLVLSVSVTVSLSVSRRKNSGSYSQRVFWWKDIIVMCSCVQMECSEYRHSPSVWGFSSQLQWYLG